MNAGDTLRAAAEKLRDRAGGFDADYFYKKNITEDCAGMLTRAGTEWALMMSPAVTSPLAAWLDHEAEILDEWYNVGAITRGLGERSNPGRDAALEFARLILGDTQQ